MLLNRIEIDTGQTVRKPWSKPALSAPILGLATILAVAASRIDMRSRSRIGLIDRGVNARRIREFLGDLNQERSAAGVGWGLPKRVTGPHGPWPPSSRLL